MTLISSAVGPQKVKRFPITSLEVLNLISALVSEGANTQPGYNGPEEARMETEKNYSRQSVILILALVGLVNGMALPAYSSGRPGPSDLVSQFHNERVNNSSVLRAARVADTTSPKSILIYGPSLDPSAIPNEQSLAQAAGYAVTVVGTATWSSMTTAQFAAFDAIVFGDPSCFGGTDLLATADATKLVWSRAVTGSVYIQGTDPVWHGFTDDEPVTDAQTLIANGINFVAAGPGTGLYVSLSCYYGESSPDTPVDFLSGIGAFKVADAECADAVTVVKPTHPAMAGLSDASLSNWTCSVHEFITTFPTTFEVLAAAIRSSDGENVPYIIAFPRRTIPIIDAGFFVTQQYRDFLNREPDASGLAFWTNEITACGNDSDCIEAKRVNVSAAFFLSIEFQQTGYLVYRVYKAAYGNISGAPVPIKMSEFLPDTQAIGQGVVVNQTGWEQLLENNKQAFMSEFAQRSRFTTAFPTSMTPAEFVDKLFANAGVTPTTVGRTEAINEFSSATTTNDLPARARALRRVGENGTLTQQEFNRAFVLMQYFGYLRRNPNDPPEQTLDFQGYNFWLTKLNQFDGNFVQADMVKSFLVSGEYRQRFGQP